LNPRVGIFGQGFVQEQYVEKW